MIKQLFWGDSGTTVTFWWCSKDYLLLTETNYTFIEIEVAQDYRKSLGKGQLVSKSYSNTLIWNTLYTLAIGTIINQKDTYPQTQFDFHNYVKVYPCIFLFYDLLINMDKVIMFHLFLMMNYFRISQKLHHQNHMLCNITLQISTSVFWKWLERKANTQKTCSLLCFVYGLYFDDVRNISIS